MGSEPLRNLVAAPVNREFGLLEHLQSALLLITALGGLAGFRRAGNRVEQAVCVVIAAGSFFILLEEIDFGLHYWEYLFGESGLETLNVHNQGNNLPIFKTGSDVLAIALFVIFPLAAGRLTDPRLTYFVPDRLIAVTVIAGLAVSQLAHILEDAGLYPGGPLDHNVSEFRETFTYYAFMLYGLDLALCRKWPSSARGRASE
ncbi:MAG: hypothetical protein M3Y43_05450 [Pseudomonadota bacterium]|nr:hypothetical protein [Pseudomonadota bacterium]MDQ2704586.1 hypothetical protein [Pseudomonadota bacterium]